ncbi:hypothetical protein GCM10028827_04360 [Mucilaginibacter myungsuensis]
MATKDKGDPLTDYKNKIDEKLPCHFKYRFIADDRIVQEKREFGGNTRPAYHDSSNNNANYHARRNKPS